jgi:glucoamylase
MRLRTGLAVLVLGLLLAAPAGAAETWTAADKKGFGTAYDTRSKVWFTLGDTRLDEVYWPDAGTPAVRGLELRIGDERETTDATGQVTAPDPRSLTFRQVSTARSGRWRVTKTFVTDPARNTLLVDVDVRSLTGRPVTVDVAFDPALHNGGSDDRGSTGPGGALLTTDGDHASALLATPALQRPTTVRRGDVRQRARLALDGVSTTHATFALGFGRSTGAARRAARGSLTQGFPAVSASYAQGWHAYLDSLAPRPAAAAPYAALYDMSLMVLAASEDKTYRGASIASPSMPWAWGDDSIEKVSGPYHLVWARDLYHVATAQLAAGDRPAAERLLDFLLFRQQLPDGSFPQNSEVDGEERWEQKQMDQVAFPIVLAWQLSRTDARSMERVRRAGAYLLENGPITGQERWENQRGWSPATIAAEIAGLICGADLLRRTGDPATAARWEATADSWQRSVQAWTATSNGPLSDLPYYVRITKDRAPNRPTTFNNGDSGPSAADQRRVVDPSFLELVRLGVKPADDPVIQNTVRVVDDQLRTVSRVGTFWRRFSFDGYGETETGRPWAIGKPDTYVTYGRAWPLLTGERGEYELLAGRPATDHLRWMAGAASSGLMLPEQVWDGRPPSSGVSHTPGKGTFAATPLAWSHAQFVRLALSMDAGAPVERPSVVACRYATTC